MKREDVRSLFADATDEQVKTLLDINSADITKALVKQSGEVTTLQGKVATLEGQLTTATTTITNLEANKGDTVALQKQIDEYKAAEETRKVTEATAQLRATIEARFNTAVGERAFLHDFVRNGVLEEFIKALDLADNKGKGDADVLDAITKDKGYFASRHPPANMGSTRNTDHVTDKAKFDALSLYEQMLFAREHPEQAAEFMK